MSSSAVGSACFTAQRDIKRYLQPRTEPLQKRFFPRDRLFDYLSTGSPPNARAILECDCHRCVQHRRLVGTGNSVDAYLERILGNTGKLPSYESSALSLFSLFVAIECPTLCRSLLDKSYDDKILQLGADVLSKENLKKLWPMSEDEFELDFYGPLETYLAHFAVPHITLDKFTSYDSSTILPFINEKPIGRVGEGGDIVDEGGSSKVSSFEIYSCYNRLQVCSYTHEIYLSLKYRRLLGLLHVSSFTMPRPL